MKGLKNFITNSSSENLKKRLIELIKGSEELKFLVGFFYFSGIRELYEALRNNPDVLMKVLVGLNVDRTNYGLLEFAMEEDRHSDEERCYRFLQSVKRSLNSDEFDTEEFYEQVRYFINLIKEGRLQIRKTYEPNHAKLYLFKLGESQIARRNLFITGSSNLTRTGITTQNEFNVEISDYGFEDAEAYFDTLWDKGVRITEDDVIKNKLIETIENRTPIKEITPFKAFVLVLKHYVETEKRELGESLIDLLKENGYTPYQYQLDAIKQALSIIENHNGVIIADVVGLGKTIIACAVARELKKRGIVICPPGLIGDRNRESGWLKYLEDFRLYEWEVRSSGDLENTAVYVRNRNEIEVVIIDEAHRFRNQDTKGYEYLKNICRGRTVIMLTATPFNNRPGDILSLLKLFVTPKKSSITLEENLVDKFRTFKGTFDRLAYINKYRNSSSPEKKKKAETYYENIFGERTIDIRKVKQRSHYLSKRIRDVIEPVTIRRNRLDLQNNPFYKDEIKELSRVADPVEWFYELTKEQSEFYDRVIKDYFGDPDEGGYFKGAIYRPFEYKIEKKKFEDERLTDKENFQYQQQRNLYDFMRRLLVKRFESSFGSFRQSIENFKNITVIARDFIKKTNRYILDRSLLERIYDLDLDEIERHLEEYSRKIKDGVYPKNHEVYEVDKFKQKDKFLAHIDEDIRLFERILNDLNQMNLVNNDPKLTCLIHNLKEILSQSPPKGEPERKVVIFSEYLDTVRYLEPVLKSTFNDRVLVIKEDLSPSRILEINRNFDASFKEQEDRYDILLGTDRISEGLNLNRAGMVINYDIPWNPVRVIQRVGRINRISKKVFNELYIVNFFPTEQGAELVKSREIAGNKMFLIHNTLGEDAKIFDIDEELTPSGLYERIQTNPDYLEEESFYTKALNRYMDIKERHPELIKGLDNYPSRIKVAKRYDGDELLVFFKKGRLYIYGTKYDGDPKNQFYQPTFEEVFERIACSEDEKGLSLSEYFWDRYNDIKNLKEERSMPTPEQSIENKALNNIKTLIQRPSDDLLPFLDFLRTLREDVIDYGTLPDYTLRRIANLPTTNEDSKKKVIDELSSLMQELGEDYLLKEREKVRGLTKEIIVAIENQRV